MPDMLLGLLMDFVDRGSIKAIEEVPETKFKTSGRWERPPPGPYGRSSLVTFEDRANATLTFRGEPWHNTCQ